MNSISIRYRIEGHEEWSSDYVAYTGNLGPEGLIMAEAFAVGDKALLWAKAVHVNDDAWPIPGWDEPAEPQPIEALVDGDRKYSLSVLTELEPIFSASDAVRK